MKFPVHRNKGMSPFLYKHPETLDAVIRLEFSYEFSFGAQKFGEFPESLVVTYIKQTLQGLEYLHANGVIHRDIKGTNILLTKVCGRVFVEQVVSSLSLSPPPISLSANPTCLIFTCLAPL